MPNNKGVTLYIRQGIKSKLFSVAAHVVQMLVDEDRHGNKFYRPCQNSLYFGQYTTWEEAVAKFKQLYHKQLIPPNVVHYSKEDKKKR